MPIFLFIRILWKNDGEDSKEDLSRKCSLKLANEVSIIYITIESSLQSILTLWLILRGIIRSKLLLLYISYPCVTNEKNLNNFRSPLDFQSSELVSWSHDKFGNPVPVPGIPLASIITSLLSLIIVTIRVNVTNVVFSHFKAKLMTTTSRVLMVVFSMIVRVLSVTFLWIYFDSKTTILLVTLLVINFSLAYKLEFNKKRRRRNGATFSIWMTSFINIFTPCWYNRQEAETETEDSEMEDMKRISTINLPCSLLMLTWVAICFTLVNYSQFRYNNNVLNNDDFVLVSLSLATFILINIFLNCLYLYNNSSLRSSRDLLVIITCFLSLISSIIALSLYISSDESRNLTIIAQHYQNRSGDPKLYLKSYRAFLLRDRSVSSGDLGEVITCNTLMNENEYGEDNPRKVLMLDPVNAKCGQALKNQTHINNHIASVLVFEDWDYRSSSPYPRHHRHLSMESLLSLPPPISLLSISKLSRLEFERFTTMRTFLSTLEDDNLQSLQHYTQHHLTVNCGDYSCVNLKSRESIFLNNDSYPSMHVQITSEEMSYSHSGLYRLASFRTEDYFANIRLRIVLRFTCLHFTCRCGGAVTLGLDDLFCEPMDQFWHLEYLDNYKCCSDSGLSVLTSQECLDSPGVNSWSSWSTWSGCERLITVSGVENVRRRYRLSRSGQDCLSVLLEAETCDEDKRRTGGCVDREIIQSLPRC